MEAASNDPEDRSRRLGLIEVAPRTWAVIELTVAGAAADIVPHWRYVPGCERMTYPSALRSVRALMHRQPE